MKPRLYNEHGQFTDDAFRLDKELKELLSPWISAKAEQFDMVDLELFALTFINFTMADIKIDRFISSESKKPTC